MAEDEYESEEYVMGYLEKLAQLSEDEHPKRSKRIRQMIKRREEVNNLAIEIIEEKSPGLCAAVCALYAEKEEGLHFAIEMGWAVNRFRGVHDIFNNISHMCVENNHFESALMYRIFAIAVQSVGVEKGKDEEFDNILRRTYNVALRVPDEDTWDQAYARMVLNDTETEAMWKMVKEGENDD